MQVDNIKFFPVEDGGKLRAMVSFSLSGKITFHSWKIIDGENGLFVAAPSQESTREKGKFFPMVFINDSTMRDQINEEILQAFASESKNFKSKKSNKSNFKSKPNSNYSNKKKQEENEDDDLPF